MAKELIAAAQLRAKMRYDHETGLFYWVQSNYAEKIGTVAGNVRATGYRQVTIGRRTYLCHRLAWLYVYGEWPKSQIDHIDGDKDNNRISNLRDMHPTVNNHNKWESMVGKRLGFRGVRQRGKVFEAQIKTYGVSRRLGIFGTAEEAHQAYLLAKRAAYPELFALGSMS